MTGKASLLAIAAMAFLIGCSKDDPSLEKPADKLAGSQKSSAKVTKPGAGLDDEQRAAVLKEQADR